MGPINVTPGPGASSSQPATQSVGSPQGPLTVLCAQRIYFAYKESGVGSGGLASDDEPTNRSATTKPGGDYLWVVFANSSWAFFISSGLGSNWCDAIIQM